MNLPTTTKHSSTCKSPFKANHEYHLEMMVGLVVVLDVPTTGNYGKLREIEKEIRAAMQIATEDMKQFYDIKQEEGLEFKVGDKVMLDGKDHVLHLYPYITNEFPE